MHGLQCTHSPTHSLAQVYASSDVLKAKFELLSQTNMVDEALDVFEKISKGAAKPQGRCMHYATR